MSRVRLSNKKTLCSISPPDFCNVSGIEVLGLSMRRPLKNEQIGTYHCMEVNIGIGKKTTSCAYEPLLVDAFVTLLVDDVESLGVH